MKNLIVGQSGGPTAVINSSLYGVICEGFNRSEEIEHVYGMVNGIQGFLDGRFMDMKELEQAIDRYDAKENQRAIQKHHQRMGSFESGHACEKVCAWIRQKSICEENT